MEVIATTKLSLYAPWLPYDPLYLYDTKTCDFMFTLGIFKRYGKVIKGIVLYFLKFIM